MIHRRAVSRGPVGLRNAHRLAPHIADAEPIAWFGTEKNGRRNAARRSSRAGFVIGLVGGGGLGLLMQVVAGGF